MNFKQNLASVLAGAYKLDYRWLQIKNHEIFFYKDIKNAAETPLALHFDPAFNAQVITLCEETVGSITEPILIDTILQAHCAAEAHEIYYDEKLYAEKAVAIRHKPNELTAILETGERYLLTLNGVVKTNPGDWVIRGVNGEEYPCDPEIFKMLYDVMDESKK